MSEKERLSEGNFSKPKKQLTWGCNLICRDLIWGEQLTLFWKAKYFPAWPKDFRCSTVQGLLCHVFSFNKEPNIESAGRPVWLQNCCTMNHNKMISFVYFNWKKKTNIPHKRQHKGGICCPKTALMVPSQMSKLFMPCAPMDLNTTTDAGCLAVESQYWYWKGSSPLKYGCMYIVGLTMIKEPFQS